MPIGSFAFRLTGADMNKVVRTDGGRFVAGGFQTEARAANKNLAYGALGYVARTIESNVKRPTVSSGRLISVTLDRQNAFASPFNAGVGNIDFLNRSNAKYWRFIEEGSAAAWGAGRFTSLQLVGFFGATLQGSGRAGPAYSLPNNTSPRGVFHPVTRRKNGIAYFRTKGDQPDIRLRPFSPRHEVQGMHAYRAVYESGGMAQTWVAEYRRLVVRYMADLVHMAGD